MTLNSRTLFITTSPRTPAKMIPEIALLNEKFSGQKWNKDSQTTFMFLLKNENFFNGNGKNDPAFSARDRINRAPKSLGFVNLTPAISLTPAGKELIASKRTEEIFLRQLLKFQLPSPFHRQGENGAKFNVKPYLEFFRLIRRFGTLKFDELQIFGMQLTDWKKFDDVVAKIEKFRNEKAQNKGNYKKFKAEYLKGEIKEIYEKEINSGETKTRESREKTIDKFIKTKAGNLRDYADAAVRYLRATGMVNISHIGKSLSIIPEEVSGVDYFLKHIEREINEFADEKSYIEYLGNAETPKLLTDDKTLLLKKLKNEFDFVPAKEINVKELKQILEEKISFRKDNFIQAQIGEIKKYHVFDEIQTTFAQIKDNSIFDPSLMLEWNVWRAMTMLDGGDIRANLKFDDFGNPMATAQGNMADIVCDYGDFGVTVEVTMATGQKQYEMEGEPVARHLGKFKEASGKEAFCLFVAPAINDAAVAHFFVLQKMNIAYYGGKSTIVPLPLSVFEKMVENSCKAAYAPNPKQVKAFFIHSISAAEKSNDEKEWFEAVKEKALNWPQ